MSNLYKKLNISALDVFKFNRYYKFDNIISRKITPENDVESTYLKIADDSTYIYANESSPLNNINELSTAGLSEVCIKYKDNNKYKHFPFYIGYSLTYTQNVNVTNLGTYMYAYDYISSKVNDAEINKIIVNINHDIVNGQKVNKFSDVVCSLKNDNLNDNLGTLTNGSNEINLKLLNIKNIISNNNYGSVSFDVSYSYVTSDDGLIHDDGKCTLDELTGVHMWSMNSYIDDEQYSYKDTDYTDDRSSFIVYTYINANQTLLDRLENSGTSYLSYALMDVSNENWWSQNNFKFVNIFNNQAYLMYEETKQQYFTHLRPYNLTYNNGTCTVDYRQPFSNIYRYPSWRDNKDYYYACQKMITYVGNLSSIYPKSSDNYNFNTSYFIKKIGNLPVHIVPQSLQFELIVKLSYINRQSSGDNPEEGEIRFKEIELYDNDNIKKYTINFKDDKTINLTPYNINDGEIKRTLRISHVDEFEIIDNDEYFKISDWKTTPNSSSFIPSFDPNNEHGNEYKISFKLTEKLKYSINNFYKFIENNSIINKICIHLEATGSVIGITGPSFDINVEGTNDNSYYNSYYMCKKINGNYEYDIIEITRNNNETEHINGTITYISTTLNYYGLIHDGDNKN